MNNIFKKIYNNVLVYEKETIKLNTKIDSEINELVTPYTNKLSDDELEQLKNALSSIALTSEQIGLELGVKFILNMLYSDID